MLYTRNAKLFREYYKVEKAQNRDRDVDVNFIDLKHPNPQNFRKGFGSLIFGSGRDNVESFLRSTVLNVAADQQSVYELIQNADDCDASFISISYNDKYLLCINNGKPFSDRNMAGLINVGDSDKTLDEIGTYGIGFKIVHRLLGEDDGADAIVNDYAGAVIFSWNKFTQFDRFLKNDEIKIGYDKEMDAENPWLIKLIYTCFPTHLDEPVRISDYDTKKVLFENSELDEFRSFLSESLSNINISQENFLRTGSMVFIKLAEGKSKSVIEKNIEILKSGIAYSFNFLQSLNKIYINGESILAQEVITHSVIYPKDSKEFIDINPRNKERPIEAKFGFNYSFANRIASNIPNFYTFFSMDDEKNNFGFLLHCNAFDKHSDRRKLQPDSQSNPRLFSYLIPDILSFVSSKKGDKYWDSNLKKNFIPFNELYAIFLLAEEPKNKPQILEGIYLPIKKYLLENIPTLNRTYSNNTQNVKIKDTRINVSPSNFGCPEIEWFAWQNDKTDKVLIDEALNKDKLNLKKWDIIDLLKYAIEKGNIEIINEWVKQANEKHFADINNKDYTYLSLIQEIDKSISESDMPVISKIKLFKFSDGNYYSLNEIFTNSSLVLIYDKIKDIKKELRYLGLIVSNLDISKNENLLQHVLPKINEENIFKAIAENSKENTLSAEQKHNLFFTIANFDRVGPEKLKDLELFKDTLGKIRPLRSMLKEVDTRLPNWLDNFKISPKEYLNKLDEYLVKDKDIYQSIIYNNWDLLIGLKLNIKDFYTEVTGYYQQNSENQKLDKLSCVFTNDGFKQVEQVFFNTNLNGQHFYELQNAILKITNKSYPSKLIFDFLVDDKSPFKVNRNDAISGLLDSVYTLSFSEALAVLEFSKLNNEKLFSVAYIEKQANEFLLTKHAQDVFQYYSARKEINELLAIQPNFKLLPQVFNAKEYKELGVWLDKGLYMKIINTLNFSENLISVVRECDKEVQLAYLDKIKTFSLQEGKIYDKSSFEHQCLKLAIDCYDANFQVQFTPKILINDTIRIKDISVKDEINFEDITLSLASVLPTYKGVSDIITKIINQFKDITKSELAEKVFPINNKKKEEIYSEVTAAYPILQNIEQFAFVLYYSKHSGQNHFLDESLTTLSNLEILNFAYNNNFTEIDTYVELGLQNKIYPSELGLETEHLPLWVLNWIDGEDSVKRIAFISSLGVFSKDSTIFLLRNYFLNKSKFETSDIAKDTSLSDGKLLLNTLLFIKENGISISNENQYLVLKEIERVVNSNKLKNIKITIEDDYDSDEIINNSVLSEIKSKEYQILLFKGKLPRIVTIDEISDYVFYRYNEGDYFVNNFDIYINEDVDHKKTLEKVVSDENNDFTFEDLWNIYNTSEPPETENPFSDITPEDEEFIKSIITGVLELNEKLDANTTAKIKTLMAIRSQYSGLPISNQEYSLKAGVDEILVRSAQSGILYLDAYNWSRLGEANVRLSVYTKNQIEIYDSQEQLINYTKPQNKFGIVRMPNEYSVVDYNSLDKVTDKGKWHFIFIVNENTLTAKSYKEAMNLEDYNF